MALTLVEAVKLNPAETFRNGVIELFARESDILRTLPFMSIPGGSYHYNQEGTLPGVGFRGVNEGYTESTGVLNPKVDSVVISGGDIDVDKFLVDIHGVEQRVMHTQMKIKSLAQQWHSKFIKGDSDSDPREFDGLQKRLGSSRIVSNGEDPGAANEAGTLSFDRLDETIDLVDNATHLIMTKQAKRSLLSGARSSSSGMATINHTKDDFGRQIETYAGLPILIADANAIDAQYAALGNNETPVDTANITAGNLTQLSSVYVVSFGDGFLTGIDKGGIQVRDLGEIEDKPVFRTRIEWYSGLTLQHPRAAARLADIDVTKGAARA